MAARKCFYPCMIDLEEERVRKLLGEVICEGVIAWSDVIGCRLPPLHWESLGWTVLFFCLFCFWKPSVVVMCFHSVSSFFISNNVSFVFDVVTPFNYSIISFGSGICLFCFSVSFGLFLCKNCDTFLYGFVPVFCFCWFFLCLDSYTVVLRWVFYGFFPSIAAVNFCSWWLFMNNNCFV